MRPASPPSCLFKSWGDEAVVYDTASGDTHYLKPLTLALYKICRDREGATAADLTVALAARLGVTVTPQFQILTEDALASLRRIGLLETA